MKDSFMEIFKSKISLKVTGKNIERFIRKLYHHQVEILKLSYPNYKTVILTIYAKDYKTVMDLKTI